MNDPVQVLREGPVVELVLDRPERRNALSARAMTALREAFEQIAVDDGVGAVLVRGTGGFFCSGLDLKEIDTADPPTDRWVAAHTALSRLDVPVVAAVEGGAINAGAALALGCDLLVVGAGAYLQVMEAELGMTPPVNAAWLAVRYPPAVGLQLALTCRRFGADELQRLGIALDVVDDDAVVPHARALVSRLAGFPNRGAALAKRTLRDAAGSSVRPFAEVVDAALTSRRAS